MTAPLFSSTTTTTRPLVSGLRVDRMRKANRARLARPTGWWTVPGGWTTEEAAAMLERYRTMGYASPAPMLVDRPAPKRTRWWRRTR